ncbi:MAG TPA: hypothetical protein VJP02_21380 [Candidatus Sulfotelmatobacter sp.]|nr:hypothetical protein [Candidatus Sulfotelmatobacter sp.]
MQNLRKYVLFAFMAVFVASLAITPAHAQGRLAANVPFDFVLGQTTMKANSYTIESQGSFVALVDAKGRARYTLYRPGSDAADHYNGAPYLVFTRYGTETFLSKIVFSTDHTYDLPRSSKEKELAARLISGEQVAVAIGAAR